MRIFDRFLVLVLVVVIVLIGIGLIAVCFEPQLMSIQMSIFMDNLIRWRWLALVVGAILIVLAVVLLLVSVLHRSQSNKHAMVDSNVQGGNVQVAINAIDVMVSQVIKNYTAVKSTETSIRQESGGVVLQVGIVVSGDSNIPELSAELQSDIRNQLENMAGLKIKNVIIMVKDVILTPSYGTGAASVTSAKTTAEDSETVQTEVVIEEKSEEEKA